jgi:hypothetical protein
MQGGGVRSGALPRGPVRATVGICGVPGPLQGGELARL